MKVISLNSKVVDGKPQVQNLTVVMSIDECRLILKAFESMKPQSNEVIESIRTGVIETFKNY